MSDLNLKRCWCGNDESTGGHVHDEPRPRQGWECPRCHTVYAPWVFQCKGCKPYRPESWVAGS